MSCDGVDAEGRWQTSYLSGLPNKARPTHKQNHRKKHRYVHGSLTTDGINCAQPRPVYKHTQRGKWGLSTIAKDFGEAHPDMHPSRLHPADLPNKPHDPSLNTGDVPGAVAQPITARPRDTDPLWPDYKLPGASTAIHGPGPACESSPPPLLRNTLRLDDIDEAGPKRAKAAKPRAEQSFYVDDIEGTTCGWAPRHIAEVRGAQPRPVQSLNAADINTVVRRKIVQREEYDKGDIHGKGTPKALPGLRSDPAQRDSSLRTSDIPGVHLMVRRDNDPFVTKFERRQYRQTNYTGDIERSKKDFRTISEKHRDQLRISQDLARRAQSGATVIAAVDAAPSVSELGRLCASCRTLDRDASGKLTPAEVLRAAQSANVGTKVSLDALKDLADSAGFVCYRNVLSLLGTRAARAPGAARESLSQKPPSEQAQSEVARSRPGSARPVVTQQSPSGARTRPTSAAPSMPRSHTATTHQQETGEGGGHEFATSASRSATQCRGPSVRCSRPASAPPKARAAECLPSTRGTDVRVSPGPQCAVQSSCSDRGSRASLCSTPESSQAGARDRSQRRVSNIIRYPPPTPPTKHRRPASAIACRSAQLVTGSLDAWRGTPLWFTGAAAGVLPGTVSMFPGAGSALQAVPMDARAFDGDAGAPERISRSPTQMTRLERQPYLSDAGYGSTDPVADYAMPLLPTEVSQTDFIPEDETLSMAAHRGRPSQPRVGTAGRYVHELVQGRQRPRRPRPSSAPIARPCSVAAQRDRQQLEDDKATILAFA